MYKYIFITLVLMAAGCSQQIPAPPIAKARQSVLNISQNNDISPADLVQTARDVLAGMYFTIEKADVQNGIVRTRPLPGAQFFEFWRCDNIGPENTFAANLHTIRRTATLVIRQKTEDRKQNAELSIDCQVRVQRMSYPEGNLRGGSRIYGMFSQSSQSLQRLVLNPEQAEQMAWIELGPDRLLEEEILRRIETQIKKQQTAETKT